MEVPSRAGAPAWRRTSGVVCHCLEQAVLPVRLANIRSAPLAGPVNAPASGRHRGRWALRATVRSVFKATSPRAPVRLAGPAMAPIYHEIAAKGSAAAWRPFLLKPATALLVPSRGTPLGVRARSKGTRATESPRRHGVHGAHPSSSRSVFSVPPWLLRAMPSHVARRVRETHHSTPVREGAESVSGGFLVRGSPSWVRFTHPTRLPMLHAGRRIHLA